MPTTKFLGKVAQKAKTPTRNERHLTNKREKEHILMQAQRAQQLLAKHKNARILLD